MLMKTFFLLIICISLFLILIPKEWWYLWWWYLIRKLISLWTTLRMLCESDIDMIAWNSFFSLKIGENKIAGIGCSYNPIVSMQSLDDRCGNVSNADRNYRKSLGFQYSIQKQNNEFLCAIHCIDKVLAYNSTSNC